MTATGRAAALGLRSATPWEQPLVGLPRGSGAAPYVEVLETTPSEAGAPARPELAVTYLAVVGVAPADVYGTWAGHLDGASGAVRTALVVAYRDRADYALGRRRFWQWVAPQDVPCAAP